MVKSTKTLLNVLFLLMAAMGSVLIFNHSGEGQEMLRVLPVMIITVYSLLLLRSLTDCWDNKIAVKRINSVYHMGFLFTMFSLLSMILKLKAAAGYLPENRAAALALSFLFIAVTAGFSSLIMRYLVWKLYRLDNQVVVDFPESPEEDWNIPA